MINLKNKSQSLSPQEFSRLIENYRQQLPNGERLFIALENPFHQLAALYAGLIEGRRVLSASSNSTESERASLKKIFLPHAYVSPIHEIKDLILTKKLDPNRGLIGVATSGSSGTPKIVLHKPSSLLASAKASCDFYEVTSSDIIASPLPLNHVGGLMPFWRALVAEATLILPKDNWIDVFELHPTHTSLVPTQLLQMLESKFNWEGIKCVLMGAQALDPNLFDRASAAGAPISVSYGSSESAAQICGTPVGVDPQGSVGIALKGREVKIINERIAFKGEACFWCYQDGEQDVVPFDEEGFFHTEDMGIFDEQGRLYVLGRADHIFKCGGENVNPHQLEQLLSSKLKLDQIMVVPIPDHQFGNLTCAFMTPFSPARVDQIREFNKKLPPHERIRHARADFPHSAGIKVSRSFAGSYMKDKVLTWGLSRLSAPVAMKPDMVFLHGFMGDHQSMKPLAENFSKEFNVWGIDLPFHGVHQNSDLQDWNQVIDELAFILMRFSKLYLYGYSMGGRLCLGLINRYPYLASKVIIEGAHPGLTTAQEKSEREKFESSLIEKMNSDSFSNFLINWYQAPLFSLDEKNISDLIKATKPSPDAYEKALKLYGLSKQPNLSREAESCVAVVGELDKKYALLLPHAVSIPNVAHKASYLAPAQVFKLVMPLIAK